MRLSTRCPACATRFRVVPDQLRLADGWVRCGRCSEVFDARRTLVEDEEPGAPPAASAEPTGAPELAAAPASASTSATEPAVSFLRVPAAPPQPARRGLRFVLALGCVLAAALLVVQVAVHERDRLAAQSPALVPWLEALCEPLACTLSPLRRIDAVVIDASDLARLREDAYRLQLALTNKSAADLALPAIELTLTDAADQPVVRRVITPAELRGAATPSVLAGGAQWNTQVVFSVTSGATRVAGYRVLAFYP